MYLILKDNRVLYSLNKNIFPHKEEITWSSSILLSKNIFSYTQGDKLFIGTTNEPEQIFEPKVMKKKYFNGILKSNLQKCIRRGLSKSAVRTAYQLINQNLNEFLRRWIIIIAEDSIIHPDMLYAMWLCMAHSKGYKITNNQVEFLLDMVYQVAESKYYDKVITDKLFNSELQDCVTVKKIFNNPQNIRIINKIGECCLAMLLRSMYGGMKGDMIFLKSFNKIWKKRINDNEEKWVKFLQKVWKLPERPQFNLIFNQKDKYLFSIDWHCCNYFMDKLNNQLNFQVDQEDLKKTIWYWRSGWTEKQIIVSESDYYTLNLESVNVNDELMREEYKYLWNKIFNIVDQVSVQFWY